MWPQKMGRDGCRTPMPWTRAPGAGFTTGTPWLPIADEHLPLAVRDQVDDPHSLHAFYVDWLGWHRRERLLREGSLQLLPPTDQVLAFERVAGGESLICVFNLSGEAADYRIDRGAVAVAERSIGARLEGGQVRLEQCGMLFARVGG
jgi:alpha-glucosidase